MKILSYYFSSFLFYLLTLSGFAQNQNKLTDTYSDYFRLNSESLYLHLNKTEFLPNEDLWFSAYSYYNEYQEPSRPTTNLHVSIYDKKGHFLESKIIYMQQGFGSGYFELDPETYKEGEYVIRATTNYLKNFNEDLSFFQSFKISGEKKTQASKKYELLISPEGGNLLEGVENTVVLRLTNKSGHGRTFKGKLYNSKGEAKKLFESNRFGYAKFSFTPKPGERYKLEAISQNEEKYTLPLPEPSAEGLALQTSYSSFGDLIFHIRTNESTYKKIKNDSLVLAIHQEGKMKTVDFKISDSLQTVLDFRRNYLYPGTNTITVFNRKNEPLLQRMVFNRLGIEQHTVEARILESSQDSLTIELISPDLGMDHSLSLAVLPTSNNVYSPEHSILSAFLLEPYLSDPVEDGGYYFERSFDMREKDYDLDLLLMAQGNGKYFWNDIFNNPPAEKFSNEKGFTIKGQVKNDEIKLKKFRLAVIAPDQNFYEITPLDEEGNFEIQNTYLLENSEISFNLINTKNERTFNPEVRYQILPEKQYKDLPKATLNPSDLNSEGAPFIDEGIDLATVSLEEEKEKVENPEWQKKDAEDIDHTYVIDYIRNKGFKIWKSYGVLQIYSYKPTLEQRNGPSPIVVVNGVRLSRFNNGYGNVTNLTALENLEIKDLKSIKVNRTGAGQGIDGGGGYIEIELKEKDFDPNSAISTPEYKAYTGFSLNKDFFIPTSLLANQNNFDSLCIAWFNDLRIKNGKAQIRILNTGQPELKLIIEGMAADGGLISKEFILNTEEETVSN